VLDENNWGGYGGVYRMASVEGWVGYITVR
jgi:hypothetical protein